MIVNKLKSCQYCGRIHSTYCPNIKAIEYFENGSIKRVEFKTDMDYQKVNVYGMFPNPNQNNMMAGYNPYPTKY